jgi:hypothetical protein
MEELIEKFVKNTEDKGSEFTLTEYNRYTLGPWSISKLKCLQKCPFQFYLKYLIKAKLPRELQTQDMTVTHTGSAAHRILEFVTMGKDIASSFSATHAEFVLCHPPKLTQQQWDDNVTNLEMSIIAFQERFQRLERAYPIKRVLTELRIGVTKDWEPTGFFSDDVYFRGVIDLVVQLENGDIIVIDHKTGGGDAGIRYYEEQLNSYKVMYHFGVSHIKGAQSGVHFIRKQDVIMGQYSPIDEIENKLRNGLEWSVDGAIDSLKEIGFFKHKRSAMCQYCEFNDICKAGKLKPLELSTKSLFKGIPVVTQ